MAIRNITYSNKVALNENSSVADINKGRAVDWNEIKAVVNNNATETSTNTTDIANLRNYVENSIIEIEEGTDTSNIKKRSIKFANGFMINTYEEFHADSTSSSGGVYIAPEHSSQWLTPFTEFYSVSTGISTSNRITWLGTYYKNLSDALTNTPLHRAVTNASGNLNYRVCITAFGRWK